jgi:ArsR family transcriptional regulator
MKDKTARVIDERCQEVSGLLGSLAHPVRLKILCLTLHEEQSVSDLTAHCKISQSAMSQFLLRMRDDGLLSSRREGTRVYYAIKDRRVIKLLNALKDICT